jgi:protein tyrosine phosphatase
MTNLKNTSDLLKPSPTRVLERPSYAPEEKNKRQSVPAPNTPRAITGSTMHALAQIPKSNAANRNIFSASATSTQIQPAGNTHVENPAQHLSGKIGFSSTQKNAHLNAAPQLSSSQSTKSPDISAAAQKFAQRMEIPRNEHRRKGGENQLFKSKVGDIGYMTRYPETNQQLESLLSSVMPSKNPLIVNLMNRGDMGETQSYVDKLKLNETQRWGRYEVRKTSEENKNTIGDNGQGGHLTNEHHVLQVRDTTDPASSWKKVDYNHINNWEDTTTLPPETLKKTFEILQKALYKNVAKGERPDPPSINCAGGVGRTGVVMGMNGIDQFIKQQNSSGRTVSPLEAENALAQLINDMRDMRGTQVLPDKEQVASMHELMATMLRSQNPQVRPNQFFNPIRA